MSEEDEAEADFELSAISSRAGMRPVLSTETDTGTGYRVTTNGLMIESGLIPPAFGLPHHDFEQWLLRPIQRCQHVYDLAHGSLDGNNNLSMAGQYHIQGLGITPANE